MKQRLGDGVEGPGANDFVALRSNIGREELCVPLGIEEPMRTDLRCQRAGKPGVEDVRLAFKPAWLAALSLRVAWRRVAHRIHGELLPSGEDGTLPDDVASLVEGKPHGDGHAEVALPRQTPVQPEVLGPVAVAHVHVARVPLDLGSLGEKGFALVEQAHEPLARREEFERAFALLVELDGV